MAALKGQTILIISPQSWGKMLLSKHHYATELASYGNTVYFLNPPDKTLKERISIMPVSTTPGFFLINHKINFPYNLKFHAIPVFHWLMQWQIRKILQTIGKPVDIIWSFDLGHLYPFWFFGNKPLKIFHPVDEPLNNTALQSARGSQVIFSVTFEILAKYAAYHLPAHFINHGVSEVFLQQTSHTKTLGDAIRVGFSGNLLRPDIDRPVFLKIIKQNPEIIFECWGSYQTQQTNIGGAADTETFLFIESLQQLSNVRLHGVVSSEVLAKEYQRMDAFLICYDVEKDQSKGTNYHKVMEYLAAGKVIVSNNITTYSGRPGLVTMVEERDGNYMLPELFKKVISSLPHYNSIELQQVRVSYATANTYHCQIGRIEAILDTITEKV